MGYPKTMTKKEFIDWFRKEKEPYNLDIIRLDTDIITVKKIRG